MTIIDIIYTLFIAPIKLFFEILFSCVYNVTGNPGLSIVFLSLSVNILILPLYIRADMLQKEEQDIQKKMAWGINHIKKTFKGDERMMMLQTYYRKNSYSPLFTLRSAAPLMLEIPFFIAAYGFLSNLPLLSGAVWGPISDLGRPDGLLYIFGTRINILPIVMTALNIISCLIFTKGQPLKSKLQLYGMAFIFLVFLYNSPSGLVLYWTLNNLFSLIKTVFYKIKHPRMVIKAIASVAGVLSFVMCFRYLGVSTSRVMFFIILGLLLEAPAVLSVAKARGLKLAVPGKAPSGIGSFVVGEILLTVIIGLMIPASVISASPLEFISSASFYDPFWYLLYSVCLSSGIFLIWLMIFYYLASDKGKVLFTCTVPVICCISIADYMFFGKNLGRLSPALQYDTGIFFSSKECIINILVIIAIILIVSICMFKQQKFVTNFLTVGLIAAMIISVVYMHHIYDETKEYRSNTASVGQMAELPLSKSSKNVVVMMLDRALGEYIPYIMTEKPELMKSFDGFTYYPNTISYGPHTSVAAPALFGGYEYTPENINLRSKDRLVDKHDEALKLMPYLFSKAGYDVTVCDPPYAGYKEIPDLTIYDDIEGVHTYITQGMYTDETLQETVISQTERSFFCYSVMKASPVIIQPTLYEKGNYHSLSPVEMKDQATDGTMKAEGYEARFLGAYSVLENLKNITRISSDNKGCFIMLENDTTHMPVFLQKDDYEVSPVVDNTAYGEDNRTASEFWGDASDRVLHMEDQYQVSQYHCNMAAYLKLAEWFDYLRDNDLYNNTRIILVADHGYGWYQIPELFYDQRCDLIPIYAGADKLDLSFYNPLLMVKDFNAKGFDISYDFMTNADTPLLAMDGIVDNPVNPYTGSDMNSEMKNDPLQYILQIDSWELQDSNQTTYDKGLWWAVHDDIWDIDNWSVLTEKDSLPTK